MKGGETRMKKLFALSAAAALVVATVGQVVAFDLEDASIRLRSNVGSDMSVRSNTGRNFAIGGAILYNAEADDTTQVAENELNTGVADAMGVNTMAVNANVGPLPNGDTEMEEFELVSRARVRTTLDVEANSGENVAVSALGLINAEVDDLSTTTRNRITTGDAVATGDSLVVVNSNWSGSL